MTHGSNLSEEKNVGTSQKSPSCPFLWSPLQIFPECILVKAAHLLEVDRLKIFESGSLSRKRERINFFFPNYKVLLTT